MGKVLEKVWVLKSDCADAGKSLDLSEPRLVVSANSDIIVPDTEQGLPKLSLEESRLLVEYDRGS